MDNALEHNQEVALRKQLIEEKPLPRNDGPRRVKAQTNYLTKDGREKPDPTPIAPPIGYKKHPTMVETMRAMIQRELSDAAGRKGLETFEEADDFDVGDDYDPRSPYEELFEPTPVAELRARAAAAAKEGEGGPGREGEAEPPSPDPVKAVEIKAEPDKSASGENSPKG